jgi:antirestriction protein ArdC
LICVAIPKRSRRRENNNLQLNLFDYVKPEEINSQHTYFRFIFKYLFNESQVNGYFGNQPDLFNPPIAGELLIRQLIEKSNAKINTGGESAFYSLYRDEIQMPEMARFRATNTATIIENYYVTIIHELIHWTAHETRCSREMLNGFGTPKYAFEELIAELGSALLCTQLNQKLVPMVDHAQYLNNWLKVLKNDFSYFTEALELARTAIYFLNDLTGIYPFLKPQHKRKINDDRVASWSKLAGVVNDKAI